MPQRILVVEDSRTQAMRLKLELQRCGAEVEIATTGTAGMTAAQTHAPNAIILDVDLPEIDGYSLCRKLKSDAVTAHIPVVMLTHRDEARDTMHGLEAGAEDYIPKDSFAEQNLMEALRLLGVL
jgi:DNA-binding response OmpR family regulator